MQGPQAISLYNAFRSLPSSGWSATLRAFQIESLGDLRGSESCVPQTTMDRDRGGAVEDPRAGRRRTRSPLGPNSE